LSAADALQWRLPASSGLKSTTLAPKHKFLKADLGGIDFVDSEGLGSILGTYIVASSHGCDLMLVNVNSRVKDLLNITHLEVVFENRT
jgi:anti-anti-sigma factor